MVDFHGGDTPAKGQRPGHAGPYQQGSSQAGTGRIGDAIKLIRGGSGFRHDLFYQGQYPLHMIATGQLRDHATKTGMHLHLAVQGLPQQTGIGVINGHPGLVTA